MNAADRRPVTLLICALGGEGGGVLAEWLVETATRCGYAAQSTSIPGVAQRTGSTTYYFEVFPVPLAGLGGRRPVFSLYPVPGALDVLVSSELLETVRQVGNGMASPERTLVVSSSSRTLTTAEKVQLADGRASSGNLLEVVRHFSRQATVFDMAAVARDAGTVVSAVLFGAIAGSGALPFPREAFEEAIRGSGRGAEASLRGFAAAYDLVAGRAATPATGGIAAPRPGAMPDAADRFPPAVRPVFALGAARLVDYQDAGYAALYAERLARILAAEQAGDPGGAAGHSTTAQTARYLALWMAFDDVVRVADLKSRASRHARVRAEVKAGDGEIVRIYDHFKPGVPEFAGLLPAGLARALVRWDRRRTQSGKKPLAMPLKLPAHSVCGMAALRLLAGMRWLRRRGSRYAQEQAMIERWLSGIEAGLKQSRELGHEIALCGRLVKGYGGTNDRGKDILAHVLGELVEAGSFPDARARARAVREARLAALADDAGRELDRTLASHGAAPRPVKAQPVHWVRKQRSTAT